MATNTQRKVLAGIVVLGAAALIVDRCFLGGATAPKAAAAAELLVASAPAPAAEAVAEAAPASSFPAENVVTVAQRLGELPAKWSQSSDEREVDGFAAPKAWLAKIEEEKKPEHAARTADSPSKVKLALTMIGRTDGVASTARINGKMLRVGEQIHGYTLVAVRAAEVKGDAKLNEPVQRIAASATLENADGRVELALDPSGMGGGIGEVAE